MNSDFVLQELKLLDNAMGSGHVLVYAFDVFMQLYLAEGFRERDAAECIIKHNIFGLEIDKRAYQLAYFALMMKGREYNRRILNKDIKLHLYRFIDFDNIPAEYFERLEELSTLNNTEVTKNLSELKLLLEEFKCATELGSVIKISNINFERVSELKKFINVFNEFSNMDTLYQIPEVHKKVTLILNITQLLTLKYTAIVTNPPYLNKMSSTLDKYVKQNYSDVKTDLFSVFIKMNSQMLVNDGYAGFMTPFVWMFIKSYEALRTFLITSKSISNLIQFEYSAFEEATVPICCFTIKNAKTEAVGNYFKLSDFYGGMKVQEEKVLEAIQKPTVDYFYQTNQLNFQKIPGSPISFWVSENLIHDFVVGKRLDELMKPRQGMATSDNNRFLRLWFEVNVEKIMLNAKNQDVASKSLKKWFPYNKGGEFRRWYGNYDYLINWEQNGQEVKEFAISKYNSVTRTIKNIPFYFRESITWSLITSGGFSSRYREPGSLFDVAGMSTFSESHDDLLYLMGVMNSPIGNYVFKMINPTLNLQAGDVKNFPLIEDKQIKVSTLPIIENAIKISKDEWETFEIAWNFKKHPLI